MTAPFARQRAPALLLTLLLHLGLFGLWQIARQPKPALPAAPMTWLTLLSPRPQLAKPAAPPPPPLPVVPPLEASGRTAADIMRQAKRDLGKIDSEIRAADAKWVRAPASTPHSRMQAAFDAAKDAVPPKWYEAARIIPLGDHSGNGPRLYKIVTSAGTYCIRIAANNTLADMLPKGYSKQDQMSTGIRPTYATCPQPF
jgi:hypothetical protein